jgi:hypothetical protein
MTGTGSFYLTRSVSPSLAIFSTATGDARRLPPSHENREFDLSAQHGQVHFLRLHGAAHSNPRTQLEHSSTKALDFSDPLASGVKAIAVTGPRSPVLHSIDDLSGQEVFARETGTYVANIYKYYIAYRLIATQEDERQKAKASVQATR